MDHVACIWSLCYQYPHCQWNEEMAGVRMGILSLFLCSITVATASTSLIASGLLDWARVSGHVASQTNTLPPSRRWWMLHLGVCLQTCRCQWAPTEIESSLPPVTFWHQHWQQHGRDNDPCCQHIVKTSMVMMMITIFWHVNKCIRWRQNNVK